MCCLWGVWSGEGRAQDTPERQALAWFHAGEMEKAAAAFQDILARRPDDPVALYHLGRMAQDPAGARRYFLRLVHYTPGHEYADDALLAVARSYFLDGRYPLAVRTCNRLLSSYAASDLADRARYWLGRALLADHKPALAELTFLQLLTVHPTSPLAARTRLGLAGSLRKEGRLIDAARTYLGLERDRTARDSLRIILFRAGRCLEGAGKDKEAQHVYRRLIVQFPESREASAVRQ